MPSQATELLPVKRALRMIVRFTGIISSPSLLQSTMCDPATLGIVCKCLALPACQSLCNPVQDSVCGEACTFICLEENWRNLSREKETLVATERQVDSDVTRAENQLGRRRAEVELWQQRASNFHQEAPNEEEYNDLARCYCDCTPNLLHRYRLGKRVGDNLVDVRDLIQRGQGFQTVADEALAERVEPMPGGSSRGLGSALTQLWAYFDDPHRCIIGIHGLGGVGKTTLLKQFNNDFLERNTDYQSVIFIDVYESESFNVMEIQRKVAERVGLSLDESQSEIIRAKLLLKALGRRKFVIVLDNVRDKFQLHSVGIPTPDQAINECKVIVASRSVEVCVQMGAHASLIEVERMDEDAAWDLFRSSLSERVRAAMDSTGGNAIYQHARAIVTKCSGLPLALTVMGKSLACAEDAQMWKDAQDTMEVSGTPEMYEILRYSYDQLPSHLKPCFRYCSLFPDYGPIDKEQLVDYWMAEGFIPPGSSIPWQSLRKKGRDNIHSLVTASLLERGDTDSKVKMHRIIRQLACWIASVEGQAVNNRFLAQAGVGLKTAPREAEWKEAAVISLMSNDIKSLPPSPTSLHLLTLLLRDNPKLLKLEPYFFKFMPLLRVLDLSYTAIEELPIASGALTKLEYLNLRHTRITKLPRGLRTLIYLIYLNLSETSALATVPRGVISKLNKLRYLNLYKSLYGMREVEDFDLTIPENLAVLGITVHSKEVLNSLQRNGVLAESVQCISLQHCERMESIQLADFQHMYNLEELFVKSCNDLTNLMLDGAESDCSARPGSSLQVLTLSILPNLKNVALGSSSHVLQNLRDVTIESCIELGNVTWVLQLRSLESLAISNCGKMEQVTAEDTDEQTQISFPNLKTLILKDLNNLMRICNTRDFPSLQIIRVETCPSLKTLPLGLNNGRAKLQQICGSRVWWDNLEWNDNMETTFRPFFVPI